MVEFELFNKKKKRKEKEETDGSDLFDEPEIDIDSDHPVHEEFVSDKRIREMKKRIRKI